MTRVKKKRKAGKVPSEVPLKIAAFRKAQDWTATVMAAHLGLSGPNIIYAWESGQYEPSAENYIALANLAAPKWTDIEWFLRRAGIKDRTLRLVADMLLHRSQMSEVGKLVAATRDEMLGAIDLAEREAAKAKLSMVSVSPLLSGDPECDFPAWALQHPASTRYVKTPEGDLVLIDTTQDDLRKLNDGELIAVKAGDRDILLGFLRKQAAGQGVQHYMLRPIGDHAGDAFLGSSVSGKPPDLTREGLILGRIAVWIIPSTAQTPKEKKS